MTSNVKPADAVMLSVAAERYGCDHGPAYCECDGDADAEGSARLRALADALTELRAAYDASRFVQNELANLSSGEDEVTRFRNALLTVIDIAH